MTSSATSDLPLATRSEQAVGIVGGRRFAERLPPVIAFAMIVGAAIVLAVTRLVGLDRSLWGDEVYTVVAWASRGPSAIFSVYTPNDHMLFSLLAWATSRTLHSSAEWVYRLWAVVPALSAVVILGAWLWRRGAVWTAALFAVLVAASPVHFEHARDARGYGLGMFAGALMLVSSGRLVRLGDRTGAVGLAAAGFIGTATHPAFAPVLIGQVISLLPFRRARRPALVAGLAAGAATLAFYAPVLSAVIHGSQQQVGVRLPPWAPVTGVFTDLLDPSVQLFWHGQVNRTCELACYSGKPAVGYALLAGALLVASGVLLWRRGERALLSILVVPIFVTYLILTVGRFYFYSRLSSFLLFHSLVLVAFGLVAIGRLAARYGAGAEAVVAAVVLSCFLLYRMGIYAQDWIALPEENFKAAGAIVNESGIQRVVTNSIRPQGLDYYISAPVHVEPTKTLERIFCKTKGPLVYVDHPLDGLAPHADTSCLSREGAIMLTVYQLKRGGYIDVWLRAATPTSSPSASNG